MSQSTGRVLKIFLMALPPDSVIFLSPLLICPCYAAGFHNTFVDSRSLQLFIFACRTYGLQVYTAHSSYFDASILSFTNALAAGPQVEESLRAPTVSVMPTRLDKFFCTNFDFTVMVRALMISTSLYRHNSRMKTDMNLKTCENTKLCTQDKILA